VDDAATHSSVAVGEGVDRFELSVKERGLGDGVDVASGCELLEVGEKFLDVVGRGWDEVGLQGRDAADPDGLGADVAGDPVEVAVTQQVSVDLDDAVASDAGGLGLGQGLAHRLDVAGRRAGSRPGCGRMVQGQGDTTVGNAEVLDATGRDRLGPQQRHRDQAQLRLGRGGVERRDCRTSVAAGHDHLTRCADLMLGDPHRDGGVVVGGSASTVGEPAVGPGRPQARPDEGW